MALKFSCEIEKKNGDARCSRGDPAVAGLNESKHLTGSGVVPEPAITAIYLSCVLAKCRSKVAETAETKKSPIKDAVHWQNRDSHQRCGNGRLTGPLASTVLGGGRHVCGV